LEQCDEVDGLIDEIFKTLISSGKGIEINTSSLRSGRPDTLPPAYRVKRFAELGGTILTTSSDAHNPKYIGTHIKEAERIAKSAGIDAISIFENREIARREKL
jgi:histidinol-phosphatase (PHP family)